jgi:inositol-pentakisphosphate 2-kinase
MSPAIPLPSTPVLPRSAAGTYEFKLVGEGASNVVFEVVVQPDNESNANVFQGAVSLISPSHHSGLTSFAGNLLRVPKAGTKAHSYVELQEYWEAVVTPLFEPEDLVQHRLVNLGGEELVSRMNAVLAQNEGIRRADFRGSRVAQAQYGMLVEDMRQSLLLLLPLCDFHS